MSVLARSLAAALAAASIALTGGCGQQGEGAAAPGGTAQPSLSPEERLEAIWQANVLSEDRAAVCAQAGDQRMQAFRSYVDPWLTGLPAESAPTDDNMAAFLDSACTSE